MKKWRFTIWLLEVLLLINGSASLSQLPVKVACIGNSVTFGYGLKDPATTSYPSRLQQLLGLNYEVKNFGHSGATMLKKGHNPYCKTKEFAEAINFKPDIAVIHLGLNDTDPRNWPNYRDDFAPDYAWLIDGFRKANPSVKVFICRLTPIFNDHPRFRSGTRNWFWQIQDIIPQVAAANHTGLIDLHSPLYHHPDLFPDALHPNEAGAAILAKTVYQQLTGDFGGLQLAPVFAPHMVLQRGKPVSFYGKANAGEKITVTFNGRQRVVFAGENGRWKLTFPAMQAGGPFGAIIASADKNIRLDDILVGEVWLCSGQSNMAFPLQSAANGHDEIKKAENNGTIRLLHLKPAAETDDIAWDSATLEKINRLEYFSGTWQRCDSGAAKNFSAIAWYFARKLQQQLRVPVGLIEVAVGGSTTESWIDRYTLEHHPVLVDELYNWRNSDFYMPWCRERANTNLSKTRLPRQRHPYEPCYNYEAGIDQFTPFPIKGVIWYQGESNAHNIELHEILLPALVESWRKKWGYAFPFYYVQLSSLNRPSWTWFRYSQLRLLNSIPNSGMAVSSDVGDSANVHPRRKKEVGDRLAGLALHFTYGQKNTVPYGPMPASAVRRNSLVTVSFHYAGQQLKTEDGKPLRGFVLVNEKGIQRKANAVIQKNKVLIRVAGNEKTVKLLYGWEPYTDTNLMNTAGLPASTFMLTIK
jgi:sialate O-acetylesterase